MLQHLGWDDWSAARLRHTHTDHHWPKKNSWVVFGATKTFTGHQLHLFIGTHSSSTCLLNFTASNLLIPWFFLSVRSRFFFSRRTCSWSSELLSAAYYRKVPLLETALRRFADPNSQAPVVGETYMTCLSVMCKDVHNFFLGKSQEGLIRFNKSIRLKRYAAESSLRINRLGSVYMDSHQHPVLWESSGRSRLDFVSNDPVCSRMSVVTRRCTWLRVQGTYPWCHGLDPLFGYRWCALSLWVYKDEESIWHKMS